MKPTTIEALMAALAPLSIPFPEIENPTDFSRLSQEAQDAIVGAMVGEYENGPPDLAESVKDEIRAWAGVPSDNANCPSVDANEKVKS
jgi:hypothetical protein